MGFLKFLKREKSKGSSDELDLPPAPPPLEGFDDKDMDFPDIKMGDMPKDMPDFDFPPDVPQDMNQMPNDDFGSFSDDDMKFDNVQEQAPQTVQRTPPSFPAPEPQMMEQPETHEEEHQSIGFEPKTASSMHPHMRSKIKFVKVDKFRLLLGTINVVRSDLRKSDEALMKLEGMKTNVDRSFDRMKSSLHDLQKKLIFVDKTLFKGD